jgi:hypothetical protein
MLVTIFKDVTTEEALVEIEAEAASYQGLFVEMEDPNQRRFVKEKASEIKGILKKLKATGIEIRKDDASKVVEEESKVRGRLEKANEPFTLLLDDWEAERKRVLDLAKEKKRQEDLYIQAGLDHEFALLLDKSYLADKLAAEKAQRDHDEKIRVDAEENSRLSMIRAKEITDRAIELDKANRLANKEHVRGVNRDILASLLNNGVGEFEAKTLITLIAQGKINNITINY